MLGKTAGGLFWMFRYLERAENTARMIDAGLRISLTRSSAAESEWTAILSSTGLAEAYKASRGPANGPAIIDFLLRDPNNPGSIMAGIEAARVNARVVRTALTREVWEAVNECYMVLKRLLAQPVDDRDLPRVLQVIRQRSAFVRGALHGSMVRNDMYNFGRIGTFFERADNTARILDQKYYILLPSVRLVAPAFGVGQCAMGYDLAGHIDHPCLSNPARGCRNGPDGDRAFPDIGWPPAPQPCVLLS